MRCFRFASLSLSLLLVTALPSAAIELNYGSTVEAIYDDNVFFSSSGEKSDFSGRASPFFELKDDGGQFLWDFRYSPSFEYFIDQSPLKGWDHDIKGRATWQPTERFSVTVRDNFSRFGSQSRLNQETLTDPEAGTTGLELLTQRDRIKRNIAGVVVNYTPSKRVFLSLTGNLTSWDYAQETRRDQDSTSAALQFLYAFSQRTRAGLTGSWSRQEFGPTRAVDRTSKTDYYNLSAALIFQVTPTFEISMSAGPAKVNGEDPVSPTAITGPLRPRLIDSSTGELSLVRADSCPREDGMLIFDPVGCDPLVPVSELGEESFQDNLGIFVAPAVPPAALYPELAEFVTVPVFGMAPGGSDDITYFADISLTKTWEEWELRLSYQRRDDSTSGLGVASVADILTGVVRYHPSPRWTFTFTGSWVQRTQEQELIRVLTVVDPRALSADPAVRAAAYSSSNPVIQAILDNFRDDPGPTAYPGAAAVSSGLIDSFDSEIQTTTIRFALDARRKLTRRVTVFTTVYWAQEESSGDFRVGRTAERLAVRAGVVFQFDPIRFAGL